MFISAKQAYLSALVFSTVLAWVSFLAVIFFTNPQSAGRLGFTVLYSSGVLGLAGLLIVLWQIIALKKKN